MASSYTTTIIHPFLTKEVEFCVMDDNAIRKGFLKRILEIVSEGEVKYYICNVDFHPDNNEMARVVNFNYRVECMDRVSLVNEKDIIDYKLKLLCDQNEE